MKEMRSGGGEELQPDYRDGRESAVGQGLEHVSWRKVTRKGPGAGGDMLMSRRPVWLGCQSHGEQYRYIGEVALEMYNASRFAYQPLILLQVFWLN